MSTKHPSRRTRRLALVPAALAALPIAVQAGTASASRPAHATSPRDGGFGARLVPGDLLLSTSVYPQDTPIVAGQTELPPGCGATSDPCSTAVTDGSYPGVFNNDTVDGSFGVASSIVLDELDRAGNVVGQVAVPDGTGASTGGDHMVTSFSSKSELALNLSTSGDAVTFMGYDATPGEIDVSNSNTPGVNDPGTNTIGPAYYRVIGELGADGRFHFTLTNAFSGDNGRAAILDDTAGASDLYLAGNSADTGNDFIESTGAQLATPSQLPESAQTPGAPTPVGSFAVTELGLSEGGDVAKEDNYRGLTIANNVLYYTKGSGGKGINSVYFVDTTGKACPNGAGVPQPGAALPTTALGNGSFTVSGGRLQPDNMCVLAGFPQVLNKGNASTIYPFGMFFANADTLYVADEGNGDSTYANGSYTNAASANNPTAGLQKWVYDSSTSSWHLAYTLQSGLDLGQPYDVSGYPTGDNTLPGGSGEPWAPATDGLRNLTGRVNPNGTVTIYATTSTVSGSGDQGADPNKLVAITDQLGATTLPADESFSTLSSAPSGTVYRGISFTPGTEPGSFPGGEGGHGGTPGGHGGAPGGHGSPGRPGRGGDPFVRRVVAAG